MKARSIKRIVSAGRGPLPTFEKGTKAVFHYEVRLLPADYFETGSMPTKVDSQELTVIDDTRKKWPDGYGAEMEMVFGKEFQLPLFEECLQTMLNDEIAAFDCQPVDLVPYPMVSKKLRDICKAREHGGHASSSGCCMSMAAGLGYAALDELMKRPAPLRITFHLVRVLQSSDYEAHSWQLDAEDKLNSVDTLKTRGNDEFRKGRWTEAARHYMEAIDRLDTLMLREKPGEPEYIELDKGKRLFYLNLAQCQLNLGNSYEAVQTCTEVLDRDAECLKALFRRAKAYTNTWELENATADLQKIIEIHPDSAKLANDQLQVIAKLHNKKEHDDKNVYSKMFHH